MIRKLLPLLLPFFMGCTNDSAHTGDAMHMEDLSREDYKYHSDASNDQEVSANAGTIALKNATAPAPAERDLRLIRKGEYRFQVDDLDTARATIQRVVYANGGYIQGDAISGHADRRSLVMQVRLPSDRFQAGVQALQHLGKLEHQTMQVSDVTTEWTDVEARLKAKRALEARYLELVSRSDKISEVLEVERELGKVRSDIESMEAHMRGLADRVSMSTLVITCTVTSELAEPSFASNAAAAIGRGSSHFAGFILALLHIWPFILIIFLVLAGLHFNNKRSNRRKVATTAEA